MERIEKIIEVNAPLQTVYNQWTQFEQFPRFMDGVKEVRQLDDRRLYWRAEIMGKEIEWEAIIEEQIADDRIAWRSTSGHPNSGVVSFTALDIDQTEIRLVMEYEPLGAIEKIADALGAASLRVEGALQRFKTFIEARQVETGAWRGEIRSGV